MCDLLSSLVRNRISSIFLLSIACFSLVLTKADAQRATLSTVQGQRTEALETAMSSPLLTTYAASQECKFPPCNMEFDPRNYSPNDPRYLYQVQLNASALHCAGVPGQCGNKLSRTVTYQAPVDVVKGKRQVRLSAIDIKDKIFNLPFEPGLTVGHNGWLYGKCNWHYAIDYSYDYTPAPGCPSQHRTFAVRAAAPGRVIHIGWENGGGNTIVISHDANGVVDAYRTIYHHLRNGARNDCQQSWSSIVPTLRDAPGNNARTNYIDYLLNTRCYSAYQREDPDPAHWGTRESLDLRLLGRKVDAGQFLGWAGETGFGGYNPAKNPCPECGRKSCQEKQNPQVYIPNTHLHVFWAHRDPSDSKWYLFDPYGIYGAPECYPSGVAEPLNGYPVKYPVAFEGGRPMYPLLQSLAAVSWGPGRTDIFSRGPDDSLLHRWSNNGTWSQWESLDGPLTSAPAVASWGNGRLDIFARGSDNALWHRWFNSGLGWSGWESLGGTLSSAPAVSSWGQGRLDVFALGVNSLWHRSFDARGWSQWDYLGGILTSPPAAVSWGYGRVDVFARGSDNALWHRWFDNGTWSQWESLGGSLSSGPAVTSWGPGRLDIFARGTDFALWHKSFEANRWSQWESLGGLLGSAPAGSSWYPGHLEVFVRGGDNTLWYRRYYFGVWGDWEQLRP